MEGSSLLVFPQSPAPAAGIPGSVPFTCVLHLVLCVCSGGCVLPTPGALCPPLCHVSSLRHDFPLGTLCPSRAPCAGPMCTPAQPGAWRRKELAVLSEGSYPEGHPGESALVTWCPLSIDRSTWHFRQLMGRRLRKGHPCCHPQGVPLELISSRVQ